MGVLTNLRSPFLWLPAATFHSHAAGTIRKQGIKYRPDVCAFTVFNSPSWQMLAFYMLRVVFAFMCTVCEFYFYR